MDTTEVNEVKMTPKIISVNSLPDIAKIRTKHDAVGNAVVGDKEKDGKDVKFLPAKSSNKSLPELSNKVSQDACQSMELNRPDSYRASKAPDIEDADPHCFANMENMMRMCLSVEPDIAQHSV